MPSTLLALERICSAPSAANCMVFSLPTPEVGLALRRGHAAEYFVVAIDNVPAKLLKQFQRGVFEGLFRIGIDAGHRSISVIIDCVIWNEYTIRADRNRVTCANYKGTDHGRHETQRENYFQKLHLSYKNIDWILGFRIC